MRKQNIMLQTYNKIIQGVINQKANATKESREE